MTFQSSSLPMKSGPLALLPLTDSPLSPWKELVDVGVRGPPEDLVEERSRGVKEEETSYFGSFRHDHVVSAGEGSHQMPSRPVHKRRVCAVLVATSAGVEPEMSLLASPICGRKKVPGSPQTLHSRGQLPWRVVAAAQPSLVARRSEASWRA